MKKFLEQYFPVMRSRPERVSHWTRSKNITLSSHSSSLLNVVKCVLRAPVREAADSKILFISDWHWFGSERNFALLKEVKRVAGEVKPSVIVLGGDICENADELDKLPGLLREVSALAPECIAVPGNWEVGKKWLKDDFWKKLYASCGIKLLVNECHTVGAVRFHGIDDISSGCCMLPEKQDNTIPKAGKLPVAEVLVAHSPDTVIALDDGMDLHTFDAALCGHCHGGQLRMPLWGAIFCPSRYGTYFDKGAFVLDNTRLKMIISAGIGERCGSFRFNCKPEITLLYFRPARHYRMRGSDSGTASK